MPVIEVNGLHKNYGAVTAVQEISFSVDEGEVRVLGLDPVADREELHQVVGVQLQEAGLPDKLKVREALSVFAAFYRNPADIDAVLRRERLYHSHIIEWRAARDAGAAARLVDKRTLAVRPRGAAEEAELERLRAKVARLEKEGAAKDAADNQVLAFWAAPVPGTAFGPTPSLAGRHGTPRPSHCGTRVARSHRSARTCGQLRRQHPIHQRHPHAAHHHGGWRNRRPSARTWRQKTPVLPCCS
jgi:hypothetical protein